MPLFGHRRTRPGYSIPAGFAGPAEFAAAQGWAPVPSPRPFGGHLEDAVHEIGRAMYGAARTTSAVARNGIRVGDTVFPDAFRGTVNGRAVTVASAWTSIEPEIRQSTGDMKGTSVCAVELPSPLLFACVQPRRLPAVAPLRITPTGNPAFDERFVVNAIPVAGTDGTALTPDVQQRIMAHDDWVFWAERYLLGCVGRGVFRSAEEVGQRISEVFGVVTAIPASVLPDHVDHSEDDLIAPISQLTSIEDAMTMLQSLTPADRERLARSDTPLAAMAGVRTPQEAMARFKAMDPQQKMQIMTMFIRVEDGRRGH